jgi:succinyl-diaminopimelate desuccinylase
VQFNCSKVLNDNLSKLIGMRTEVGNLESAEFCADYIQQSLTHLPLNITKLSSHNIPSLIITTKETKSPKLFLQAHLDVVPGKDDQFTLIETEGNYIGRGVYDMKFAAACYLTLLEDIGDKLPNYDFGLMLSFDEETGGEDGVGYLLNKGYSCEACLLPDGGDDWGLEKTSNGILLMHLESKGKSAHGSRPWEGKNAIDNLLSALEQIKSLFGELKAHKSSVTISQITGGRAINQVPDYAKATLDMRFITAKDMKEYRKQVELIAEKYNLDITIEAMVEGSDIDVSVPAIAIFLAIAKEFHGRDIKFCHSLGASDSRYFDDKNIPTIIIRPTGGDPHGDNEWINKDELLKFYELLKVYVTKTTQIQA